MDLLLLRHAKAEERAAFAQAGGDDGLRPLTEAGTRQMRKAVRGLRTLVPRIDLLAASPLLRAMQTAAVVARAYGVGVAEVAQLAPGRPPSALLSWLNTQRDCEVIAVVGHEPDLGLLASWLLARSERSFVPLKKGGACLLRFTGVVKEGHGELLWALGPAQLRALRR